MANTIKGDKYERLGHHEGIFGVPGSGLGAVIIDQVKDLLKHDDVRIVVVDDHCDSVAHNAEYYGLVPFQISIDYNHWPADTEFDRSLVFVKPVVQTPDTPEMFDFLLHTANSNQEKGYKTVIFVTNCFIEDEYYSGIYEKFLHTLPIFGGSATLTGSLNDCHNIGKIIKQIEYCILLHQGASAFDILKKDFHIPKYCLKDIQYVDLGCGKVWQRKENPGIFDRILKKDICLNDYKITDIDELKNK